MGFAAVVVVLTTVVQVLRISVAGILEEEIAIAVMVVIVEIVAIATEAIVKESATDVWCFWSFWLL